ncbi:MAG: CDP-diacylglycerol--glycerol-3-phosphate 3-phosphatidyltransferase [Fastidiosipilaceae bacterium]|jgi:CDP-diacylglycerol--glycerol-3-phosphate 3-phosphatidyltransferase
MNLPNKLTVTRMILVPFILLFLMPLPYLPVDTGWNLFINTYGQIISLLIFITASFTDHLDGSIARKRGIVSDFGKFLDPIADKMLITSVLIAFVHLGRLHAIVPILIIFRDLVVSGMRMLGSSAGTIISANQIGKWKTAFLMIGIILLLIQRVLEGFGWLTVIIPVVRVIADLFIVASVVLAMISLVQYLKANLDLLKP